MTLKQSHQTYSQNVDPKQDDNHAKFESSHFNSVRKEGTLFFKQKICQLSPLYLCKNEIIVVSIHDLVDAINKCTFNLIRKEH